MRHQHNMLSLINIKKYIYKYKKNIKKEHNEFLCRTNTDSQTLKNLWFPNETDWGWGLH